jgi:hypothetical protein
VADCAYSKAPSSPVASASPVQPTTLYHHSSCSHFQQTFAHTFKKTRPTDGGGRGVAYLGILVLRIVLSVDIARRRLVRDAQRGIAHLRWEVVLEVEEARLADVTRLGAGLADYGSLETHTCAWVPAEDGERPRTRPAFPSELLLGLCRAKDE